jgi:hypothetical protein
VNELYNYLNYLALTISRLLHHRNLPTDRLEGKTETESGKMSKNSHGRRRVKNGKIPRVKTIPP